ncbi:hypothetical protein MCOR27_001576 [Pyricularia oryzae]|nr:hypothetical protein MCOR01_005814 [Pyricularia oryzae]KAH9435036.1 hypothetical protein MCOR02_003995 [Pyricularia oryzae]KAI6261797.1 hypothetical protein MCOR19_002007 [Pyricularia oryzae]KAI6286959.1 hypothetical protein MCOR27_001576 [Pyricularia oryzae]KAI6379028.1 hypothetical protein MCOR31_000355 [Pyricularia oryzae]
MLPTVPHARDNQSQCIGDEKNYVVSEDRQTHGHKLRKNALLAVRGQWFLVQDLVSICSECSVRLPTGRGFPRCCKGRHIIPSPQVPDLNYGYNSSGPTLFASKVLFCTSKNESFRVMSYEMCEEWSIMILKKLPSSCSLMHQRP